MASNEKKAAGKSIGYVLIGISSLIMIVPFLSALMNSLKTYKDIYNGSAPLDP